MDAALYVTLMSGAASVGALGLLDGYVQGFAFLASNGDGLGQVAVKDTTTAANNKKNVAAHELITQSGTSPELVRQPDGTLAWSPHNLFVNPTSPATQNVTLITGATYTVTVTGSGSLAGTSGASGTATDGSPVTFTATGTTGTFTLTGSLDTIQINRGAEATAFVNGGGSAGFWPAFEWDSTYGSSGGWRLLVEPAATNLALYASDFTNAAWVKTGGGGISAAKTATGPDGVANSASTLTASGANGTALQAITSASSARVTAVWLKRRTGSGNIDLTQDNGSTWATQAVTSTWTRFALSSVTSANPTVGIRIVTSGDEVDVWVFQHETGTVATSPIPTYGSTVARSADALSIAVSALPWSATAGSLVAQTYLPALQSAGQIVVSPDTDIDNRFTLWANASNSATFYVENGNVLQASIGVATSAGTNHRAAASWQANDFVFYLDGTAGTPDTSGTLPTVDTLYIGYRSDGSSYLNGYIDEIIYIPQRLPNVTLQALST